MSKSYIPEELIKKYNEGSCTDEEKAIVESWYLKELAESTFVPTEKKIGLVNKRMRKAVSDHSREDTAYIRKLWPRIIAAASVIFLLIIGGYFLNKKPPVQKITVNKPVVISAGSNKATLTLGNGKKLVLTGGKKGVLTTQGHINITAIGNGELCYNSQAAAKDAYNEAVYNTITTPRGGQYQVILSDGTKVFLNAGSSLRFPTLFDAKNRRVELSGEAYFEVEKNKEKPFIVNANDIDVKVLGTHFNISAYQDDKFTATTLLEGSVDISKGSASALLVPGQEGITCTNNTRIIVHHANIDEVMAWKNGFFVFNDERITDIMKKVSRWYDVDVVFEDDIQGKKFGGAISRSKNISELLDYMKITGGIHYRIEGRRVTFMK